MIRFAVAVWLVAVAVATVRLVDVDPWMIPITLVTVAVVAIYAHLDTRRQRIIVEALTQVKAGRCPNCPHPIEWHNRDNRDRCLDCSCSSVSIDPWGR